MNLYYQELLVNVNVRGEVLQDWTWSFEYVRASKCRALWYLPTDTAATSGDSPKIFFWKLYAVINFLSSKILSGVFRECYCYMLQNHDLSEMFQHTSWVVAFLVQPLSWSRKQISHRYIYIYMYCLMCYWCNGTCCLWVTVL